MRPLLLASTSPRRQELLALAGLTFRVQAAAVPEDAHPGEKARALALRLSQAKAHAAAAALTPTGTESDPLIIGADTVVVVYDQMQETILGKPADADDAARMLRLLRGRNHSVLTAYTLLDSASGREESDVLMAWVPLRAYSDAEIEAYVASGDPLDKAGAYAIQYAAFQPVDLTRFSDCFATVMGLPVCALLRRLRDWGVLEKTGPRLADCRHAALRKEPPACPIVDQIEAAQRR